MRLYDVSQAAVVDDSGAVAGIIDESDLSQAVIRGPRRIHPSGGRLHDPQG